MAKVTISENICKGCGLCTTVCPKKIVVLAHDILKAALLHFVAENALRHWASARVSGADKQNFHLYYKPRILL